MYDSLAPGLYTGKVRHRRFSPVEHSFEYRVFMAWLDIDRLPELMAVSPLARYNRPGLISYRESDHFGDPALPLRERLRADAARQGITLPAGPIYLLTHLRYAGYCFNPISLYYCYEPDSPRPAVILAEVNNTFGESHNYWLRDLSTDHVPKQLHVSPFNTMDNEYCFRLASPGATLAAHIENHRAGARFFDATLTLEWSPWTASNLHSTLAAFPLMTLKVISAIHWEALRLFFKRVPFVPHPSKPWRSQP